MKKKRDNSHVARNIDVTESEIKDLLHKINTEVSLRKHYENTAQTLEHKIILLKNQEKLALGKLKYIRERIDYLLSNRRSHGINTFNLLNEEIREIKTAINQGDFTNLEEYDNTIAIDQVTKQDYRKANQESNEKVLVMQPKKPTKQVNHNNEVINLQSTQFKGQRSSSTANPNQTIYRNKRLSAPDPVHKVSLQDFPSKKFTLSQNQNGKIPFKHNILNNSNQDPDNDALENTLYNLEYNKIKNSQKEVVFNHFSDFIKRKLLKGVLEAIKDEARRKELLLHKQKIKEKLLKEIHDEESEKNYIENYIYSIEKEEQLILTHLKTKQARNEN